MQELSLIILNFFNLLVFLTSFTEEKYTLFT